MLQDFETLILHLSFYYIFLIFPSVDPDGSIQSCGSARCSGVSGAAGLHATDRARKENHGVLLAGVPRLTHRSGATGHGFV